MSTIDMREALKNVPKYTQTPIARSTWGAKVDRMSDNQVIAVYFRFARDGLLR